MVEARHLSSQILDEDGGASLVGEPQSGSGHGVCLFHLLCPRPVLGAQAPRPRTRSDPRIEAEHATCVRTYKIRT